MNGLIHGDRYRWVGASDMEPHEAPYPIWINAGCGTHHAPAPWINTDTMVNDDTHPDVRVTMDDPLPFPDDCADRVYLGHVLEHIVLSEVPAFLQQVRRVLRPGGQLLAVGPDCHRTVEMYRRGEVHWGLLASVLEHAHYPGTTDWPEACHQWNTNEARIVEALTIEGFELIAPQGGLDVNPLMRDWPVVGWSGWQYAVSAVAP